MCRNHRTAASRRRAGSRSLVAAAVARAWPGQRAPAEAKQAAEFCINALLAPYQVSREVRGFIESSRRRKYHINIGGAPPRRRRPLDIYYISSSSAVTPSRPRPKSAPAQAPTPARQRRKQPVLEGAIALMQSSPVVALLHAFDIGRVPFSYGM